MARRAATTKNEPIQSFVLGNEAIAHGALESGLAYAAGYPGTPSSEIIENLAKVAEKQQVHVEWSTNEKVACEGSAAAAIAGLNSMATMKNAGLSVALDFLTHLSMTGLGDENGAMVVVVCDDPDAHSSGDETDSRWLSEFAYMPLIEPTSVNEAYELIKTAFEISRAHKCPVMFRSYTRLSHASSIVPLQELSSKSRHHNANRKILLNPYLAKPKHEKVVKRLNGIEREFSDLPYNEYSGPKDPDIVIVASGAGYLSSLEAVELLGLGESVGILKLVTLWPFPRKKIADKLAGARKILVVEEVDPFVETHVKELLCNYPSSDRQVFGKKSGHIPITGEINPDRVIAALAKISGKDYSARSSRYLKIADQAENSFIIGRGLTWCPGCPHRATFWSLERALKGEKKNVVITGDIGCYTLDVFPEGKCQTNVLHAMGSGIGLAAGFGQLGKFGEKSPVVSICGDSTFFHASIPGLLNAIYNKSNLLLVILDNSATAMTGFQAHPGVGYDAVGQASPAIDIEGLCRAVGAPVYVADAFDIKGTTKRIRELLSAEQGVRVLIVKRNCELLRMKREKIKPFRIQVDQNKCRGTKCGQCYKLFRCPAFLNDPITGKASIKEESCPGCGACIEVCPSKAIHKEAAQ